MRSFSALFAVAAPAVTGVARRGGWGYSCKMPLLLAKSFLLLLPLALVACDSDLPQDTPAPSPKQEVSLPPAQVVTQSASPSDGESLTFSQTYRTGNRYHQTMSMQQRMEMDTGDGKQAREMTTSMGMSATVTQHEDKRSKRVAVKYDAVSASLNENGEKFSFDSKAPEAANAGGLAAYNRVVGQEFRVIFDELGNVSDVENLEQTIQNLTGNDPKGAQIYQQVFNPTAVKTMMQQTILRSPLGAPVKVGGEWPFSQELALPGIGKLMIHGFYTYKGMVKHKGIDCAEVTAKADIKLDISKDDPGANQNAQQVQQMQLKIETATMEGTLYYDPAIAFTRDVTVRHEIVLTGRLPDGSGKSFRLPMRQQIGMSLDSFKSEEEARKEEEAEKSGAAKKEPEPPKAGEPVKLSDPAKAGDPVKLGEPTKLGDPAKEGAPVKLGEPTKPAEPAKADNAKKGGAAKKGAGSKTDGAAKKESDAGKTRPKSGEKITKRN